MSIRRRRASLFALMSLLPFTLAAQGTPETKRGAIRLTTSGMGIGEPLTAAQKRAATAGEDALMALLKRDPALANPVGYGVVMNRSDGHTIAAKANGLPFDYGFTSFIWYYGWDTDGKHTIEMNNGRFDFVVLVNGTGFGADINEPLAADGGPSLIREFQKTGTFRGHDVYDGQCVFMTRNGQPALLPVTRERFLKATILSARHDSTRRVAQQKADGNTTMADNYAQYLRDKPKREAQMKEMYELIKKSDPAGADKMVADWKKTEAANEQAIREAHGGADMDRQISDLRAQANSGVGEGIQKLQQQLDAMSPADRKRQAYIVDLGVGQTRLAGDDDTDTTPLVQVNPGVYDKRLAPDVPQVVSVCLPGLQSGVTPRHYEWNAQRARDAALIRDGLDWAALEALVKAKS